MKIGILTFHNVTNYGGVLQCYALQQMLTSLGYDVDVIDYQNAEFKRYYSPFYIPVFTLKKICYMFYSCGQRYIRNKLFQNFLDKYLVFSKKNYTIKDIKEANDIYDYIIVGSDQVWNIELTKNDYTYMLDFVDANKRISYAASFGFNKIPEGNEEKYKNEISKFSNISVREERGKEILAELGIPSEVHVDPVFLLGKSEWMKIAKKKLPYKYICVYTINVSDCYEIASKLKALTNLEVVVIKPDKKCPKNFKKMKYASPDDFVSYIAGAEFVVTDSFHGTAFSIVLQKQFVVSLDQRKDNRNSRLVNVLEKTNLTNRIIKSSNEIERFTKDIIDYSPVEQSINSERNRSIQYLNKGMKNEII